MCMYTGTRMYKLDSCSHEHGRHMTGSSHAGTCSYTYVTYVTSRGWVRRTEQHAVSFHFTQLVGTHRSVCIHPAQSSCLCAVMRLAMLRHPYMDNDISRETPSPCPQTEHTGLGVADSKRLPAP